MKNTFVSLIFAVSLLAQTAPQTIKIRTGFDKKHRAVYATTDVRAGYVLTASKGQGDAQYIYSHGTIPEVRIKFTTYSIAGVEATYATSFDGPELQTEAGADVHYAILGAKLFLISNAAIAAGVVETAPLEVLATLPPTEGLDSIRAARKKAEGK